MVITSGGTKLNSNEISYPVKIYFKFFGIERIEIICADRMALDYEKSIKDAEKQIEDIAKD